MTTTTKIGYSLLFMLALFGFLISELYFFLNPMMGFDFWRLYFGPLMLYLLSVAAVITLYLSKHRATSRLLMALACIYVIAAVLVNGYIFSEDLSLDAIYCLDNHTLWFSLPLLFSSVFTSILAYRKKKAAA